jgi:hypothetical protein
LADDQGLVSLIDVIERITTDSGLESELLKAKAEGQRGVTFPFRMQLVSWWLRSDPLKPESPLLTRTFLVSPSGNQLSYQEGIVDLTEMASFRSKLVFSKMLVEEFGIYWFVVTKKGRVRKGETQWEEVAKVPIEVTRPLAAGDASAIL